MGAEGATLTGSLSGSGRWLSQSGDQGSKRPKCSCLLETEKQYLHFQAMSPENQIFYFGIRSQSHEDQQTTADAPARIGGRGEGGLPQGPLSPPCTLLRGQGEIHTHTLVGRMVPCGLPLANLVPYGKPLHTHRGQLLTRDPWQDINTPAPDPDPDHPYGKYDY